MFFNGIIRRAGLTLVKFVYRERERKNSRRGHNNT